MGGRATFFLLDPKRKFINNLIRTGKSIFLSLKFYAINVMLNIYIIEKILFMRISWYISYYKVMKIKFTPQKA